VHRQKQSKGSSVSLLHRKFSELLPASAEGNLHTDNCTFLREVNAEPIVRITTVDVKAGT
jgi:hypothetical protein